MPNRRPNYCPQCGANLERRTVDGRDRAFCPDCEAIVYQDPSPTGWVLVLDGDTGLFVTEDDPPNGGTWTIPGGFIDVGESPREGAARELAEETGLRVDPAALELVRTGYTLRDPDDPGAGSLVSICYAVSREHTRGTVRAGEEPTAARFWALEDLLADVDRSRSVDRRRCELALERLRDEERRFRPE